MFEKGWPETPPGAQSGRVVGQVIVGQAEDLPEVDHESLAILFRGDRRGEQVQALDTTLQDLIPSPLSGEGGIDGLEFRKRKDGAAGHQPDLSLLQVATLGDDNQVTLIGPDLVRLATDGETRPEDWDGTARQVIPLTKFPLVNLEPEWFHS